MIRIEHVNTRARLKLFIDFPHTLYKDDPQYVPELFIAQRDLLSKGKHPFHDHSTVELFLAYRDGQLAGRIAAILNNNHNTFNKTSDGFFGFFDVVEDVQVASALIDKVATWLTEKGATTIIGPVNFSTNETCGILIEGFESPPFAMMTYNKPYYEPLLRQLGFSKKVDLLAHRFAGDQADHKPVRMLNTLTQRLNKNGVTIRPVVMKNFAEEVKNIHAVYNCAWDKNLGFVPMTEKEFEFMAKDMKLVLDTDFCLVAEHNGKVIGFALAIPNINQALISVKRGRLLPFGIFKLLLGLRKIKSVRIIALGVIEGYRKMGIEACFYASFIQAYRRKKYTAAEASWVLEDNHLMNHAIQQMDAVPYKKYRILEKAL
jgi:GNAT superfamily N-acetyltransferase